MSRWIITHTADHCMIAQETITLYWLSQWPARLNMKHYWTVQKLTSFFPIYLLFLPVTGIVLRISVNWVFTKIKSCTIYMSGWMLLLWFTGMSVCFKVGHLNAGVNCMMTQCRAVQKQREFTQDLISVWITDCWGQCDFGKWIELAIYF